MAELSLQRASSRKDARQPGLSRIQGRLWIPALRASRPCGRDDARRGGGGSLWRSLLAPLLLGLAVVATAASAASTNPADLPGGRYALDKKHASVIAKVMHLGVSLYTVRFDGVDGSFTYDPAHPTAAQVSASVDATSLDVGADYGRKFAEEFLDASHFPKITFVSRQIAPNPDGRTAVMTGDLTMRGVTKPASFQVTFDGVGRGLFGGTVTGFSAVGHIKRSDFGSGFLQNLVGDDVTLIIEAEFQKT